MRSCRVVRASGCQCQSRNCPVAKFIVPEWGGGGDKVDSGIPEPMEPGGPVRQPYAGVNFIPPVRDSEYWLQGSILASSDTVESEGRQMHQC
jgi:hypothetical protein